jgi:hypothetical protein
LGQLACSGQLCQKQPSTNTATIWDGKTRSGRVFTCATTARSRRKRKPRRWSAERIARSGAVSLRPRRLIRWETPGDEGTGRAEAILDATVPNGILGDADNRNAIQVLVVQSRSWSGTRRGWSSPGSR